MAGVLKTYRSTGGTNDNPGTETDTTALGPPYVRFRTDDAVTIDTSNPVPIVSATTVYSYWMSLYLKCTTAPDTMINNIKIYTDETGYGTGISTHSGDETPTHNSGSNAGYQVATGTPGTIGTEMVTGHGDITAKTDFFTYSSASPKSVSISEASSWLDAQNEMTDYLVLQSTVIDTAAPGNKADETWTWVYDEI